MNKIWEIWNKLPLKKTIELEKRFNIQTMETIWKSKELAKYLKEVKVDGEK